MMRIHLRAAPILILVVCALGSAAYGQDLFEQYDATAKEAEMSEEKTAPGERESIF
jgi:hypothetical protein